MDITDSILEKITQLNTRIKELNADKEKLEDLLNSEKINNVSLREELEQKSLEVQEQAQFQEQFKESKPLKLNPELFDDGNNNEVKKRLNQYIKELNSYIKSLERKNKR